jgi:hypothetical protein
MISPARAPMQPATHARHTGGFNEPMAPPQQYLQHNAAPHTSQAAQKDEQEGGNVSSEQLDQQEINDIAQQLKKGLKEPAHAAPAAHKPAPAPKPASSDKPAQSAPAPAPTHEQAPVPEPLLTTIAETAPIPVKQAPEPEPEPKKQTEGTLHLGNSHPKAQQNTEDTIFIDNNGELHLNELNEQNDANKSA